MWSYNYTPSQDDIMHYGVLGMKWGHRKAIKYESKARTARQSAKEWKEIGKYKVQKALEKGKANKAKKIEAKYDKYAKRDRASAKKYEKKAKTKYYDKATKKTRTAIEKMSTGKAVGQSLMLGSYGSSVYTSLRQKGVSKGKAAAQAIVNNSLNNLTLGNLSKKAKW